MTLDLDIRCGDATSTDLGQVRRRRSEVKVHRLLVKMHVTVGGRVTGDRSWATASDNGRR